MANMLFMMPIVPDQNVMLTYATAHQYKHVISIYYIYYYVFLKIVE